MRIPTHQIHNVLNAYARQLHSNSCRESAKTNPASSFPRSALIEKRGAIIEKITADIIQRLMENGCIKAAPKAAHEFQQTEAEGHRFTFYTYTPDKEKIIHTIEIQDSQFLIQKLKTHAG